MYTTKRSSEVGTSLTRVLSRGPILLVAIKMSLSRSIGACAVLALATVSLVRAESAAPYDRCDYMNHESKAYKACIADADQAKLRAETAPVPPISAPKPKPETPPSSEA